MREEFPPFRHSGGGKKGIGLFLKRAMCFLEKGKAFSKKGLFDFFVTWLILLIKVCIIIKKYCIFVNINIHENNCKSYSLAP